LSSSAEAEALLLRVFASRYRATLISLALLTLLLVYAVLLQKLFDFLIAVVLWLQLELAYRQWWLEKASRGPQLWIKVIESDAESWRVCVKNVGQTSALDIDVTGSLCSGRTCEGLASRLIAGDLIDLPPGEAFEAELFRIRGGEAGVQPGKAVRVERYYLEVDACFTESLEYRRKCDTFWWSPYLGTFRVSAKRIPGVLTRIPEMLEDIATMVRWKLK